MNAWLEIATVVAVAAAPVSELRGAIPLAMHAFGFDPSSAIVFAVIGNFLPAVLIVYGLEPSLRALGKRFPAIQRFMDGWLARARRKVQEKIGRYGIVGLVIFVGTPLPLTGVWTGAAGATLLGLSKKKTLAACLGGILVAAAIVLAVDRGAVSFLSFLKR
jgi:uncharacterized membrane protein